MTIDELIEQLETGEMTLSNIVDQARRDLAVATYPEHRRIIQWTIDHPATWASACLLLPKIQEATKRCKMEGLTESEKLDAVRTCNRLTALNEKIDSEMAAKP